MKRNNGLSLIIHTKNEEKNIRACIISAKPIVDEIIIVDMASSDKTVEDARQLGAKIYKVKDYGYSDPVRNFALSKATLRWTLVIDADERLTASLRAKIPHLIKEEKFDAFKFPFKNILLGKWIRHSMWWPDYQLRLFKTGCVDWSTQVHVEPVCHGKVYNLLPKEENAFVHYNIADIKELIAMVDHYSGLEIHFHSRKSITADDLVKYLEHEFNWRYFEHQGYLDGMHGFFLAKFMNVYRLMEVAKYWERKEYKEIFSPLQLKKAVEKNYNMGADVDRLKQDINKLREDLEKIQSAKFYKLWQSYCVTRDKIKNLLKI